MPRNLQDWARILAFAAAVSILFSITAKEFLLGAAIVALLASRQRWKIPLVGAPAAAFLSGTLAALVLSPDPVSGLPQIVKFYAYLIFPVLYSNLRGPRDARIVIVLTAGAGVLSCLWSFVQFARRYADARGAGEAFYASYVAHRTTGFMSHWMTFSGQILMVLMLLLALLLFTRLSTRWRTITATAAGVVFIAILLNMTRSVWIATGLAVSYLIWQWRPKLLLILPLLGLAALAIGPVRDRAVSIWEPHGETDSNQHRIVTWRTGLAMIKAHPWFGLGPEQVSKRFKDYVPADVPHLPEGWYGHLHNNFLQYAAERGLPTLVALLWFLWRLLSDFVRGLRNEPEDAWLLHLGIACWIGVLVSGLFEVNLGNSEVLHLFLVVMACAYTALDVTAG